MANRNSGKSGFCKTTDQAKIASWARHRGEEPPISGTKGSGTIFSSNCTLGCFFCQNFPFSQLGNGKVMTPVEIGEIFSKLADEGVHNLNFVTPTHVAPLLIEAWLTSSVKAQQLPIVYNCSGYESEKLLKLLDGIVDIYIPDIKYSSNESAMELSMCNNYVEHNRRSIRQMFEQVGNLQIDQNGIATRGLIIRHLVLPANLAGSKESFEWIYSELGPKVHLSLMSQYFPAYKAHDHPVMSKPLNPDEYLEVLELVEEMGFKNVLAQDPTERGGA